jgi:excinuclease ABC subunit B
MKQKEEKKPIREKKIEIIDTKHIPKKDIPNMIIELQKEMEKAANNLDFETAIMLRDKVKKLQERIN